jgi:serine protease Do
MEWILKMIRPVTLLLVSSIVLVFAAVGDVPAEVATRLRSQVEEAVAQVTPALVQIHVVYTTYSEGRELKYESMGSGVVITEEGHVVTNHHVAGHARRIFCTFPDREVVEAELLGTDALTDIAIIKLKPKSARSFPTAAWGDSDQMQVGDPILAMGSPRALSQSVTMGIISNTQMTIPQWYGPGARLTQDGEDVGSLVRWLGHDAEIHPGNSGGPLVNLDGEVIGINEVKMGLAGAIPGNLARKVADALIADGKVSRSWLGVSVQPRLKGSELEQGILISGALEDSPAAAAGFEPGDVLVRLADQEVNVRFSVEVPLFNLLVADLPIGEPVEAVVLRNGEEQTLTVTPRAREEVRPQQVELKPWGITARDISFVMAKELKRPDQKGVHITSIRPGGPVGDAKPAIEQGDVLIQADDTPINNVEELRAFTEGLGLKDGETQAVLVTVERKTERMVTVANVGIKELRDPGLEVAKAWLPVETQVVTREISSTLKRPELTGFRVTQVFSGTTAEEAGLQVGDMILSVDGEKMTANAPEHYEELDAWIRQYPIGETAELKILRDNEEMTLPVELIRRPRLSREMKKHTSLDFEFTARDITFFDRAKERWEETKAGVLVEEVKPGGWAALGKVYTGDLLQEINGRPISDVAVLEQTMEEIIAAQPDSVVFRVLRGVYTVFLELEPQWESI